MASRDIIIEADRLRRRALRAGMLALVLLLASTARGHGSEAKGTRVLIRLQGYRLVAPTGAATAEEMVLTARGVAHRFRVTDRRRFELAQPDPTAARERDHLTLQADFDVLARFAKARADQQITILGEQRLGSGDLFVLTLDLCPP